MRATQHAFHLKPLEEITSFVFYRPSGKLHAKQPNWRFKLQPLHRHLMMAFRYLSS